MSHALSSFHSLLSVRDSERKRRSTVNVLWTWPSCGQFVRVSDTGRGPRGHGPRVGFVTCGSLSGSDIIGGEMADDGTVYVRYLIDDVEAASTFYATHLGFEVVWSAGAAFAEIARGNLRLLLSGPTSSAARPMPDGRRPEPGGWNRIHLIVEDLASEVERLRAAGVPFRGEIVRGPGGSQIVFDDPSGNPVELFEPSGS